jgi:dihydroxy-acid dehydratase
MDAKTFDKSKPRSHQLMAGPTRLSNVRVFDAARGSCMENGRPEAAFGGPIELVRDRDIIAVAADKGTLDLNADIAQLESVRKQWKAPANEYRSGVLRIFADQIGPDRRCVVTHPGGKAEVVCYADV